MAEFLKKIPTNLTEYPNSFKRQGAFPLEAYSVFYTKQEADTYAASDPLAYVGQTIAVALDDAVTLYIIDQNSQLKEVGSLPVGDDQSVIVKDGKIQLIGFEDATNGAVAQIKVTTDEESGTTTKELVWTQISELVGGDMEAIADRVTELEGTETEQGTPVPGAVRTVTYTNGEYILEDTFGNEVGRIPIAEAVTNFAYHATYPGKDGKTYDNVLVLKLSDGEEQIIEIEDLVKIYDVEKNATEVQVTITPSTGPTDENDPSSDQPNIISAKLTDAVKADITKGVKAHNALDHADSEVGFGADDDPTLVIIKDGKVTTEKIKDGGVTPEKLADAVKADIAKGVKVHDAVANDESDVIFADFEGQTDAILKIPENVITTEKIADKNVTAAKLEDEIQKKLGAITLGDNDQPQIDGSNISGPVAEATKVTNKFSINYGAANGKVEYDGSQAINMAFNTDMFNVVSSDAESKVMVSLNPTTVFVLDGGNAAGHTAA